MWSFGVGSTIIIDDEPIKITWYIEGKPGKVGIRKCAFKGYQIFTGKMKECMLPHGSMQDEAIGI